MIKSNNYIIIKAFAILLITHLFGGIMGSIIIKKYPYIPQMTMNLLSMSSISPIVAIIYLIIKLNYGTKKLINRNTILVMGAGILIMWLLYFLKSFFFIKKSVFIDTLINEPAAIFYYLNLFCFILWVPVIEEILFRGFFYEILKSKGRIYAIALSSFLFVVAHGIWFMHRIDKYILLELFFIFIRSIILCLTYDYGALVAAIFVHMFVNGYAVIYYR